MGFKDDSTSDKIERIRCSSTVSLCQYKTTYQAIKLRSTKLNCISNQEGLY